MVVVDTTGRGVVVVCSVVVVRVVGDSPQAVSATIAARVAMEIATRKLEFVLIIV